MGIPAVEGNSVSETSRKSRQGVETICNHGPITLPPYALIVSSMAHWSDPRNANVDKITGQPHQPGVFPPEIHPHPRILLRSP